MCACQNPIGKTQLYVVRSKQPPVRVINTKRQMRGYAITTYIFSLSSANFPPSFRFTFDGSRNSKETGGDEENDLVPSQV